jgi:hypothetical protein
MSHFNGPKIRGTHTTLIEFAKEVVGIIYPLRCVEGISYGYIKTGKKASGGHKMVTISDWEGAILLTIRERGSIQTLNVFTSNSTTTKTEIEKLLTEKKIEVKHRKK